MLKQKIQMSFLQALFLNLAIYFICLTVSLELLKDTPYQIFGILISFVITMKTMIFSLYKIYDIKI